MYTINEEKSMRQWGSRESYANEVKIMIVL